MTDEQLPLPLEHRPRTGKYWVADIDGEDGNAFVILANVGQIVKRVLGPEEKQVYLDRARSGDYKNLLAVSNEYVRIIPVPRMAVGDVDELDDVADVLGRDLGSEQG